MPIKENQRYEIINDFRIGGEVLSKGSEIVTIQLSKKVSDPNGQLEAWDAKIIYGLLISDDGEQIHLPVAATEQDRESSRRDLIVFSADVGKYLIAK